MRGLPGFCARRWRLLAAIACGVVAYGVAPGGLRVSTRALLAWDVCAALYLGLILAMMARSTHETMQEKAREEDEGRALVFGLSVVAAVASLVAIVVELSSVKAAGGRTQAVEIALAFGTILLSFAFIHLIFALNYARSYFTARGGEGKARRGLDFPGDETPDYWDFLYFSYVIGVACQTADVAITSRAMRRLAGVHGVIAFFFNTTVLALTINIAAGLIG